MNARAALSLVLTASTLWFKCLAVELSTNSMFAALFSEIHTYFRECFTCGFSAHVWQRFSGVIEITGSFNSPFKMVTKRIRSEYMKKFKDPKWETYTKCYEEMLKYRLTRRLLEHTHKPWFWSGSDSDSDSGDRSPPPCKNQVGVESSKHTELEECVELRKTRPEERQTRSTGPQPRIPNPDKQEEDVSAPQSTVHGD